METEATKELRAIKDAIAAKYKSFREFFDALLEEQRLTHPEFANGPMSRVNIRAFDEDDVTGIEEIEDEGGISRKKIYDLSGRPVQTPTKGGIYLVNGKKIVY